VTTESADGNASYYSCFTDNRDTRASHSYTIFVYIWSSGNAIRGAPHVFLTNYSKFEKRPWARANAPVDGVAIASQVTGNGGLPQARRDDNLLLGLDWDMFSVAHSWGWDSHEKESFVYICGAQIR